MKLETFMADSKWKRQLIIIEKASGESETHSEPNETSKMELFGKIFDCIQPLTNFAKHFRLGVSQGYEYASDKAKQNPDALSFIPPKIRTALQISSTFKLSSHYIAVKTRVFDFKLIHPCS